MKRQLLALLFAATSVSPAAQAAEQKVNDLRQPVNEITLTLTQGTNMAAAPSPDGTQVAFAVQGMLYVMPRTGGEARRISTWDMEVTHPAWSPDGTRIAFQNYADNYYHIWTISPDGSNARQVTSGPFDHREPDWSPDGSRLLFSADRVGNVYKIWSVRVADGQYEQLSFGTSNDIYPALNRDGNRLLFVQGNSVIQRNLATGTQSTVGAGSAPSWTPDGNGVLRQSGGNWNYNGTSLSSGGSLFPFPARFLPDGRFLYTGNGNIRVLASTGGAIEDVPFSAPVTLRRPVFTPKRNYRLGDMGMRPVRGITDPAISPDGRRIAFVALNDVWVMDLDAKGPGRPVQVTDSTDIKAHPGWTPDGKSVYFSTDRATGGFLAVDKVELASGTRSRLAYVPGVAMNFPTLSPRGGQVAFWTGTGRLETYDVATGTRTIVINPAQGAGISRPTWSPDEAKIAVGDAERANSRFREGYNKIRVIDLATRTAAFHAVGPHPASLADRGEAGPVWSPDGRSMAFIMDAVLHVMPVNPDGSPAGAAVKLTEDAADMPAWAPDSRSIIYLASGEVRITNVATRATREVPLRMSYRQATGEGLTVIRGNVWDGLQAALREDMDVVIQRNRIIAVEPHGTRSLAGVTRYLDVSGQTIMPGMWDSHVHPLLLGGDPIGHMWAEMLAWGITSGWSMGGFMYQGLGMREALESGRLVGTRLFMSPQHYDGVRVHYHVMRVVPNTQVAEIEMAKAKALNVDGLKAYVRANIPLMSIVARTAQELGVPSFTHFLSPGIQSGLLGIAHLSATQRMGYSWSQNTDFQDVRELFTKGQFNLVATSGSAQNAPVSQGGGLVTLGTDLPLAPPGSGLHQRLRQQAPSVGNFEALKMVTINAAINAHVDGDLGTVEAGKIADLVVVNGNPLEDVAIAGNVAYVVQNGRITTPEEIRAPHTTPEALAQRKNALEARSKLCSTDLYLCLAPGLGFGF